MSAPPSKKARRVVLDSNDEEIVPADQGNAPADTATEGIAPAAGSSITLAEEDVIERAANTTLKILSTSRSTLTSSTKAKRTQSNETSTEAAADLGETSEAAIERTGPAARTPSKSQSTSRSTWTRSSKAKRNASIESGKESAEDLGDLNEVEMEMVAPTLKLVSNCLKGLQIQHGRERAQGDALAMIIRALLDAEVFDGRRCESTITRSRTSTEYVAIIEIHDLNKSKSFPKDGTCFYPSREYFSFDDAAAMAPVLASLLERWPLAVRGRMKFAGQLLQLIAYKAALPDTKRRCNPVTWEQDRGSYSINIRCIDPETGDVAHHMLTVKPSTISVLKVPDTPDYCEFGDVFGSEGRDTASFPDVPELERPRHEAARKLCRLVGWKIDGKIMKAADVPRLVAVYTNLFTGPRSGV